MLLSDTDILDLIKSNKINITPFDKTMVQPASIDLCLDKYFRVFNSYNCEVLDPSIEQKNITTLIKAKKDSYFLLHTNLFVLGVTVEKISLPDNIAARFEGKSSLGRLGLLTHSTAGFIDPGFSGNITLELSNVSGLPIKLWPGMKIGQLCFFNLSSPAKNPYGTKIANSKYQNQIGPTESKSYKNWKKKDI